MKKLFLAGLFSCGAIVIISAQEVKTETPEPKKSAVTEAVKNAADNTETAVAKALKGTKETVKKAADATVDTSKKVVSKTGEGLKKAGTALQQKVISEKPGAEAALKPALKAEDTAVLNAPAEPTKAIKVEETKVTAPETKAEVKTKVKIE